mmetsp:Transcript_98708/g.284830  ORF Transcript_98708/g.284830 Transcript_98708/m.284830 type:complete len:206 (-) Transcript_98708:1143-1760(-)
MGPMHPQGRLTYPQAAPHLLGGHNVDRRAVRVLRVDDPAPLDHHRGARQTSRVEQLVPRPEAREAYSLHARTVHQLGIDVRPQTEKWMPREVRPLDLEAELRPQGGGQEPESGHVSLGDGLPARKSLLDLLLHGDGDERRHVVLLQVLTQSPKLHRPALAHHLIIHHRRRHQRDEDAAENEAEQHGCNIHDALQARCRTDIHAAE